MSAERPLPIVFATEVPRTKAATKLKKAAQRTAFCGASNFLMARISTAPSMRRSPPPRIVFSAGRLR